MPHVLVVRFEGWVRQDPPARKLGRKAGGRQAGPFSGAQSVTGVSCKQVSRMSIGVPIKLLHEAESHTITIELKSGELYRGTLMEVPPPPPLSTPTRPDFPQSFRRGTSPGPTGHLSDQESCTQQRRKDVEKCPGSEEVSWICRLRTT